MVEDIPAIFSPRIDPIRMTWPQRLIASAVAAGCLALMITAASLTPSPTGIGTHTQLGLQPCAFEARTGVPCPTCGATTSFAWMARGNPLASFYIQPAAALWAILVIAGFWTALYCALSARPAYKLLLVVPGRYYLFPLIAWALIAWAWKIFIHLRGLDGWRA